MGENIEQLYWLVHEKGLKIWECTLNPDTKITKTISKSGETVIVSRPKSSNLFENEADAIARQSFLKSMYTHFQRTPYIDPDLLEKNLTELRTIESEILKQLKDHPNFNGIDFCDVRAGGVQIRGFHKAFTSYTYGNQITIQYDFSNWEECIKQFVDGWKRSDTDVNIKSYQSFLDAGDRWGWD